MQHWIIDKDSVGLPGWFDAFPGLNICQDLSGVSNIDAPAIVWRRLRAGEDAELALRGLVGRGCPVVLLSDEPQESLILEALAAGAAGCCNSRASCEVLQQVALVVGNGGLWIGQSLLQHLIGSTAKVLGRRQSDERGGDWAKHLSDREIQVARLVASGESNKEVGRQLDISERTVKAHLTAIFSKLGLRDRLQLSVTVNGVGL